MLPAMLSTFCGRGGRGLMVLALALVLFAPSARAATVGIIADPALTTAMTNLMLTAGSGNTKLTATGISHSGKTNLHVPGYLTLSGQTNRVADNGTALTFNGTPIGTGGGDALWNNVVGAAVLTNTMAAMDFVHDVAQGDTAGMLIDFYSTMDSVTLADYGELLGIIDTNSALWGVSVIANNVGNGPTLTAGDGASRIHQVVEGITLNDLHPSASDGVTAYLLDTSVTHTTGDLLELLTGSNTRFKVTAASGYTGGGTLFLSDDGTYKAAGGGDTIWTNDAGNLRLVSPEPSSVEIISTDFTFTSLLADWLTFDNANGYPILPLGVEIGTGFFSDAAGNISDFNGTGWFINTTGVSSFGGLKISMSDSGFGQFDLGTAGVRLTNDGDGAWTWLGRGNGADEDLTWNLDDTANQIVLSTTTGVTNLTATPFYITVANQAYDDGVWNGNQAVPTMDAIRDQIDTMAGGSAAVITYTNQFVYNAKVTYNADVYHTNATVYINGADVRTVAYGGACSDETTALTTGTAKLTFRMPHAMTLTAVRASLTTAQASGSIFTVDINESGTTVLSTKLTIDNTEKTSTTAATPPVISDSALADDAEITIDIDQIGTSGATGLKIWIIGLRLP